MSVVYRVSDTFDLKIDSIVVSISPLNYKIKSDMQSCVIAGKPMDAAVLALKNSVKKIDGLKTADGKDYELEFDSDGTLKEDCVSDLLNIPESSKLNLVAIGLINGMPKGDFLDPETRKPLQGVKFVSKASSRKKS